MIKYLSPTSIQAWRADKEEFYLKYIAKDRPPRFPQTQAMSVGSSFDAHVKSYLYEKLVGDSNPKFEFDALFEAQVEPQNRDKGKRDGRVVMERYRELGCLADLMLMLESGNPRFEFTVSDEENNITKQYEGKDGDGDTNPLVLLGKPDAYFTDRFGNDIILDWKVNGFYGSRVTSPVKGYTRLRPGGACHRNAQVMEYSGVMINVAQTLDVCSEAWALQTTIYSWLCGAQIGSNFLVAIDQIVGSEACGLRVAEHRGLVSPEYQKRLYQECKQIWEIVNSNHIFRELGIGESQARCEVLDGQAAGLREGGDWFSQATRGV